MKRFLPLVLTISLLPTLACDDGTGGTGGTGGAGTASTTSSATGPTTTSGSGSVSGSTGSGSSTSSGGMDLSECQTSVECPGGVCVAVNGAFKMCATPVEEATMCTAPQLDECCSTADCVAPGAKCVLSPVVAQCTGVPPLEYNVCATDQCATNADCPGGVCAPPGTVGNKVRTCVAANCTGTTCPASAEHPAGLPCALVREPCCNTPAGFYCIETCRKNSDCMDGYCEVDPSTNTPACKSGSPICPA